MNDLTPLSPAAQALEAWSQSAKGAFAPNTEAAWRADWASFTAWCRREGLNALPAVPQTVTAYLRAEYDAGRSIATIRRRLTTIAKAHKAAGVANPCNHEVPALAVRSMIREKGTQQRQAEGFTQRDADKVAARLDDSGRPKDIRDLALVLVGRDLLARASELVAIQASDIAFDLQLGICQITMRRTKTSTEALPYQLGPDAATALRRWLDVSRIVGGPVFMGLTTGGRSTGLPLSRRDVGRILKSLAERAKLTSSFSAHSLRVGMAQDLVAANLDHATVMQAGGWKSTGMLARYTRKLAASRGAVARFYARHLEHA
jgi:site-specific recombinase XerD